MASIKTIELFCPAVGAPVQRHTSLTGTPCATPAVRVLIVERADGGSWGLIADSDAHDGVSVTNGFAMYALAACRALGHSRVGGMLWFERDSMGRYDAAHFQGQHVKFAPVIEEGEVTSSLAAMKRLLQNSGHRVDLPEVSAALNWALQIH